MNSNISTINMNKKGIDKSKSFKIIPTKVLLALCEMPTYNEFTKELEELISSYPKDKIYIIRDIALNKFVLGKKEYKTFVKKYRNVFETMKKYHILNDMTIFTYYSNKSNELYSCKYFYKYLMEHKDKLEVIKNNVDKLLQLGFNEIYFNNKVSFDDEEFKYDYKYKGDLVILENMQIIPTYPNSYVKYKANNSCYKIILSVDGFGNEIYISNYNQKILLNDLLFDDKRLPNEINLDNTLGILDKLKENEKETYKQVKNSVDIVTSTDDLLDQFQRTNKIFSSLEDEKAKEKNQEILNNVLIALTDLKLASLDYENKVIEQSSKLSNDLLDKEKKLYLRRRKFSSIDTD